MHKERELVKFRIDPSLSINKLSDSQDNKKFDQFAGRTSSYDWNKYSTSIDSSKITADQIKQAVNLEAVLDQKSTDAAEIIDSDCEEELMHAAVTRGTQNSLTATLMGALSNGPPDEGRSRTNSLRNGETSKVIQKMDLAAPTMDKSQLDSYLAQRIQSQQRDRRQSFEYFKEEAKILDEKIQHATRKRFTCFHKKTKGDMAFSKTLMDPDLLY